MQEWWCVRYGAALAWVEAPSAPPALRRSLELHPLGDWMDDASELVVFAQDGYPDHAGRHDYTRAGLNAELLPLHRCGARLRGCRLHVSLGCVAAGLGLLLCFAASVSADTSRSLTVAPEPWCASYDKERDYAYPHSVESDIVRALGVVYGPYTGTCLRKNNPDYPRI